MVTNIIRIHVHINVQLVTNEYITDMLFILKAILLTTLKTQNNEQINYIYFQDSEGVRQYIACQGPTRNTCVDMWQMILDQDVASIVMLCQISEKDKVK